MKNEIVFNKVFFSAAILSVIAFGGCKSVKPTGTHEPKFHWENKKMVITADSIRAFKELIKNYHPNLFSIYSENAVDAKIDSLTSSLPNDSITATEAVHYFCDAFNYLTYNDPPFYGWIKGGV